MGSDQRSFRIVPPKYLNRSVIIEVDRPLFAPYFGAASPVHRTRRPRFDVEDLGRAATGEPRLAATTLRLAEVGSQTAQSNASRPNLLGLVATRVGRLEIGPDDRQSRDSCRFAS
jgi:hypothetical protein